MPVIRGYWQAVQRILRLLHLWEGLPFQCGVMWDDRMGIRSKPKYWRSILSYMPLNNSPLFGLLGSQSCIEHTTRLQGYRGFPPNQFCPPPSSNMTTTTASPSSLGDDNASKNLGWNQTAKDCRFFSYRRLQKINPRHDTT